MMKPKSWSNLNLLIIILILLSLLVIKSSSPKAKQQKAELKLIEQEKLDITTYTDVLFLGKPRIEESGKAYFAPVLITKDKQRIIRVNGINLLAKSIPLEEENVCVTNIAFRPADRIVSYVERKYFPIKHKFVWKLVSKTIEGRTLWEVEKTGIGRTCLSEHGTIFMVRDGTLESLPGDFGVYLYDLRNGRLINAYEGSKMSLGVYEFSGDGNRLFFSYRNHETAPEKPEPQRLACMDASGKILWDISAPAIRSMSVSYHGERVFYMTMPPDKIVEKKLNRKLYTKMGLIGETGNIIWEVDNPAELGMNLVPSGDYYSMVLYSDQSNVWDSTKGRGEVYYCLFETLTHRSIWRKKLKQLVPQLREGWYTKSGGDVSLDNQWLVVSYSNYQSGEFLQGGSGPLKNILVLKRFLSNEDVYQQEFDKEIRNVKTSPDSKVIELLFWDGHRMLFERIP